MQPRNLTSTLAWSCRLVPALVTAVVALGGTALALPAVAGAGPVDMCISPARIRDASGACTDAPIGRSPIGQTQGSVPTTGMQRPQHINGSNG
jgi:hypothetical protein